MGGNVENLDTIERPALSYPSNHVQTAVHMCNTHVCAGCFERWRPFPSICTCDQYFNRCLCSKYSCQVYASRDTVQDSKSATKNGQPSWGFSRDPNTPNYTRSSDSGQTIYHFERVVQNQCACNGTSCERCGATCQKLTSRAPSTKYVDGAVRSNCTKAISCNE